MTGEEKAEYRNRIRNRFRLLNDMNSNERMFDENGSFRRVAVLLLMPPANEDQVTSVCHLEKYYDDYVKSQPNMQFAGVYFDVLGGSFEDGKGIRQLIADCGAGKIDLVLIKSKVRGEMGYQTIDVELPCEDAMEVYRYCSEHRITLTNW